MTTTPPPTAAGPGASADNKITLRLSRLLSRPAADRSGEPIGKVADIIVRLRGNDYPLVTGLVAAVGGREIFVPVEQVAASKPIRCSCRASGWTCGTSSAVRARSCCGPTSSVTGSSMCRTHAWFARLTWN